jgi:hypothetical protein
MREGGAGIEPAGEQGSEPGNWPKGPIHVTFSEIIHQMASRTKPDRSRGADEALHTCELLETTPPALAPKYTLHRAI